MERLLKMILLENELKKEPYHTLTLIYNSSIGIGNRFKDNPRVIWSLILR